MLVKYAKGPLVMSCKRCHGTGKVWAYTIDRYIDLDAPAQDATVRHVQEECPDCHGEAPRYGMAEYCEGTCQCEKCTAKRAEQEAKDWLDEIAYGHKTFKQDGNYKITPGMSSCVVECVGGGGGGGGVAIQANGSGNGGAGGCVIKQVNVHNGGSGYPGSGGAGAPGVVFISVGKNS